MNRIARILHISEQLRIADFRDLSALKRYLKDKPFHLYDFIHEFNVYNNADELIEQANVDKNKWDEAQEEYDYDTLEEMTNKITNSMSDKDKEDFINYLSYEFSADAPSWTFMDFESYVLPSNEWLVHFSDNAYDIQSRGFEYGMDQMDKLGLTTHFSDKAKEYGGYNFAFIADSKYASNAAKQGKYGKHAVMFRAPGIKIYHYPDEEEQIIFYGKDVNPKDIILLENQGGDWVVTGGKRGELYKSESFDDAEAWVEKNYGQYQKALAASINNETYYHGTTQNFKQGDIVKPPAETSIISEKGRKKNLDKVFFTKDIGSAKIYAGRAKNSLGGVPRVYEVKPIGPVTEINSKKGTSVLFSNQAEVIKEVTNKIASQFVSIFNVVDEEILNDPSEQIYDLIDPEEEKGLVYKVERISPKQASSQFKTMDESMTVLDAFNKYATNSQKELVEFKKQRFDRDRIVVTSNNKVVDGNHHLIASIQAQEPILYIDLQKPIEKRTAATNEFEINESYLKEPVIGYKNPTPAQLNKCKTYDQVRAFLVGNDMYVWNEAIHRAAAKALDLIGNSNVIPLNMHLEGSSIEAVAITDFANNTKWHHNPKVKDTILKNKWIKHYANSSDLKDPDFVSYYDSAIYGPWHEMKKKIASLKIPPYLYHATYQPLFDQIKSQGLIKNSKNKIWEDSKNFVYLAIDPDIAESSYAESSDKVPDEWLDKIIIFKVETDKLDLNKLSIDQNIQHEEDVTTYQYNGNIPFSSLELVNQKTASTTMEVYRGEFSGNKGGNYWSTDKKWAAQFTQTGRIEEVKTKRIKESEVFSSNPLPYAGDPDEIDKAVEQAKEKGLKAVRLDEGRNEPDSIYVFDQSALRMVN